MANTALWSAQAAINVMTTTLATVSSTTLSVVSTTTISNATGLHIYADWDLNVSTTVGAFGAGNYMALYAVPTITGAAELDKAELQPIAFFPLTTSTSNTQHRILRTGTVLPPLNFTVALFNGSTQNLTTGAGANTLDVVTYDVNLNG